MAKKKRIAAKKTAQVKKKAIATKKKTVVKKKKTVKKATASLKTVTENQRLVIHTNDITKILGINIRTAQRLLQTIREELGRKKKDYVSIKEFADYVHLGEDEVKQNLSETLLN